MKTLITILFACLPLVSYAQDIKIPVETHKSSVTTWHTEKAVTVDGIQGFKGRKEPKTDKYGGYMVANLKATGFFRTEQYDGRWWIVTPDGHPFIFKGIAGVSGGTSPNQRANRDAKYGDKNKWADATIPFLKKNGFNGCGAWSSTETFLESSTEKIPYCVIISPLKKFEKIRHTDFKDNQVVFVFDEGLEDYLTKALKDFASYKDDPWCVGYFIDNEIPWKNSLLSYYTKNLPEGDPNRVAAENWLKARENRADEPASIDDCERFAAYVFDYYQSVALKCLRKYDKNHMYLGCRFNVWTDELSNHYLFEAAGKYMDIISVNHYSHWEPYWRRFERWTEWSGKPIMVTEFYTKGEDSGMKNATGAGWVVHTQRERGLFYQNFIINLMKSRSCVGWHWFKYQDNDPTNLKADPSNRDSNKGIVDNDFNPYTDLLKEMETVNNRVYSLAYHYLKAPRKGGICLIDDDFRQGKVERFKEIFDSLDIRCTFAIVPDRNNEKGVHFGEIKKNGIKFWQHEGYSVVLHPIHSGWYNNNAKTIFYSGPEACEKGLQDNLNALKKTVALNFKNWLVYPGGSGTNAEVVKMAGKYVKYGIGGIGCSKYKDGPIQLERLFISPSRKTAEEYKKAIKEEIDRNGYVILGTHSWEFNESNYDFLIDILTYCKTIAEFETIQELIPAWLGR